MPGGRLVAAGLVLMISSSHHALEKASLYSISTLFRTKSLHNKTQKPRPADHPAGRISLRLQNRHWTTSWLGALETRCPGLTSATFVSQPLLADEIIRHLAERIASSEEIALYIITWSTLSCGWYKFLQKPFYKFAYFTCTLPFKIHFSI